MLLVMCPAITDSCDFGKQDHCGKGVSTAFMSRCMHVLAEVRVALKAVLDWCLQTLRISFRTLCSICMLLHMAAFLAAFRERPSHSPSIPCSRRLSRHSHSLSAVLTL